MGGLSEISPTKPAGEKQTSKQTLSSRDKEFARLAEEGEPFTALDTEEPVAEGEAMERVRASWTAHRFARPSPQLLRLIRSGKLTHVGFASPVSCATARDKKEKEGALCVADGGITVSDGEKASKKPLTSLRDWMDALYSTILPALSRRPRAYLEWLALARSVIAIDREYGFAVAERYATFALNDKVGARLKFGEFDARSLEAARMEAAPCAIAESREQPNTGASKAGYGSQSAKGDYARLYDRECCRVWNTGGRCNGACGRRHACSVLKCRNNSDGHRGTECPEGPDAQASESGSGEEWSDSEDHDQQ